MTHLIGLSLASCISQCSFIKGNISFVSPSCLFVLTQGILENPILDVCPTVTVPLLIIRVAHPVSKLCVCVYTWLVTDIQTISRQKGTSLLTKPVGAVLRMSQFQVIVSILPYDIISTVSADTLLD